MSETAERIRAAVVRYVSYHPTALDPAELAPIRNAETFRDEDGTVHVGSWPLEAREDGPALVRPQGVGSDRRTVLSLAERDGDWQVTGVDEEPVEPG